MEYRSGKNTETKGLNQRLKNAMLGAKMLPCGLLWKYLGLNDQGEPRTSFLDNGLFRITQPRSLNDPFEMKPRVLLDRYSDEDWTVAREQAQRSGMFPSGTLDDKLVEDLFLTPLPAGRMDEKSFPGLWPARDPKLREEPFKTIAEFDEFRASRVCETLENILNERFGIFSMTEDPVQLLMWTHYGAEHRGFVVGFQPSHPFFAQVGTLRRVEYRTERVSVSSNDGVIRVAGHWLVEGQDPPVETLLRKHPDWAYEKETRLIVPLAGADEVIRSETGKDAVYLLRFPETAVRVLILGARIDDKQAEAMVRQVRQQNQWGHLRVFRTRLSESEFALTFDEVSDQSSNHGMQPTPHQPRAADA